MMTFGEQITPMALDFKKNSAALIASRQLFGKWFN